MPSFSGFRNLKANFTTVPNQYFDKVVGHYHPCVERVVGILIRATLGWEDPDTGERRLEAELSLRDFIRPELSESSARTGIAGAIEAGFIVQTMEATNRQPARYALRWEDGAAQKQAIVRQRKAHGSPKRRGVPVSEPAWKKRGRSGENRGVTVTPLTPRGVTVGPLTVGGLTVTPPNSKDSEKKSSSEKKQSFKKGLPSALGKREEPDPLDALPPAEFDALEAEARTQVIAENGDPVRRLAKEGKAWTTVRPMMRKILLERMEAQSQRAGASPAPTILFQVQRE